MKNKERYRRRKLWINSQFQWKFAVLIVGIASLIIISVGALYINCLSETRRILGVSCPIEMKGENNYKDELVSDLHSLFREEDTHKTLILAGCAFLFIFLLALVSIWMSFKAAGPIYAVSRMIRNLSEGDIFGVRPLRAGDDFKFLEQDMRALQASLGKEALQDAEIMQRCMEMLPIDCPLRKEMIDAIKRKLARAQVIGDVKEVQKDADHQGV